MSSAEPPSGGNDAAWPRYFCRNCSITVTMNPSARSILVCPLCQGGLTQESDIASSSSTESNFFRNPFDLDLTPIMTRPPTANPNFPFRNFFQYLDYCLKVSASSIPYNDPTLLHREISQILQNYLDLKLPWAVLRKNIVSLPDVNMTADLLASDEVQCPVCAEDFKIGEVAKQLPCKHAYHDVCIATWLQNYDTCPVCRFKLMRTHNPRLEPQGGTSNPQSMISRFETSN